MTRPEAFIGPHERAEQAVTRYETTLADAVAIAYPEQRGEEPILVFPAPTKPRAEAPNPNWTPDTEQQMRALAAEFGYGRESDRTVSELGLSGAHVIYEAGKPWKIAAEVAVVAQDSAAEPTSHTFTGSLSRLIGADEQADAKKRFGFTPVTEYDLARTSAEHIPGFEPNPNNEGDRVLPLSYDIHNDFAGGTEATGQFVQIGTKDGKPVILLRIDRENYEDATGSPKYRKQPQAGEVVQIVNEAVGGEPTTPIALVTSATYQASHEVAVLGAGLHTGRPTGVATYGTARLAEVKGEPVPTPPQINQLPGELRVAAEHVANLKARIAT